MLCIPDYTTHDWIANQLYEQGYGYNSWIGYSDLPNNDGNYEWVSGCSSSYVANAFDYDDNDCFYLSGLVGYFYNSIDCSSGSFSVACSCQYPISPTSLPTLTPSSPTFNP